jgi:seryl-tRNA synthetase
VLDIRTLRSEPDETRRRLERRGSPDALAALDRALALDVRRRDIISNVEVLKAQRNEVSREVGVRKREGADAADLIADMQTVADRIRALDGNQSEAEADLRAALLEIPNLPDPRVPPGGEEANQVLREWGEPVKPDFEPRPHWEIGSGLGVLDLERGARIAGSGFPLFVGAGARLSRALIDFMLDLHTGEHGYVEVAPPFVATRDCLIGTGQLPKFEDDVYRTEPDDLFLIPTAEVPVTNMHRGEILDGLDLPRAYVSYTPCFRREAGAAGRDTRGLLRVHQFDKVELVRFTEPQTSAEELELLTRHAETVLERLGLPYRRVLLAGGDLGFSNAITYDLEGITRPGVPRSGIVRTARASRPSSTR